MKSSFKCPAISLAKKKLREKRKYEKYKSRMKKDPEFAAKKKGIQKKYKASRSIEKKEIDNQKKRDYYYNNRDELLSKRDKWRKENRERENETAMRNYRKSRDSYLARIYAARRRRDPTIGIHAAILSFSRGSGSYSEVLRLIERADKAIDGRLGSVTSAPR